MNESIKQKVRCYPRKKNVPNKSEVLFNFIETYNKEKTEKIPKKGPNETLIS